MRAALFALALIPTTAAARCPGDMEVMSCQIGTKVLEICYWKGAVMYSYGPPGRSELDLATPLATADYTPWPGIGRAMWDTLAFYNRDVTYEVWSSIDRMDPKSVMEGGINVLQGGQTIAALSCNRGTVQGDLSIVQSYQ